MNRKATIWLSTTASYLGFLWLAKLVPSWIGLPGKQSLILFLALALIGLAAFLFSSIFLTRRQPAPPAPKDPLTVEMEAAITQARRRLLDARVARGQVLQKLPAVFVLGPRQHHKTSTVIRSGVHAELLSGDVLRGAQVVPTHTTNVWLAGSALIVEVGADVAQSPERFARLLWHFQPARFARALTQGEQAPRAALLCFSCEDFRRAGARDAVLASARDLRTTLSTVARMYGIRLPVYVLFTKADSIPGFKEYVKRFTADEVRGVLGATLPLSAEARAAEYADRASERLRSELTILFECLAVRRIDLLEREDATSDRPRAYQFPRELRKLEPLLTDFLVEVCRPSDLATNPFVRGFYFSGVREHFVGDAPMAAPSATSVSDEAGATALLGALQRGGPTSIPPRAHDASRRREAQWVFLDRLLSLVILSDASALGLTRAGTRISFFRRAALATGAALAATLVFALVYAFAGNRSLQAAARRHATLVAAMPMTPVASPEPADLRSLDSLGAVLDHLSDIEHGYTPLHLRWGLYQGKPLYEAVRQAYFRQFARLMFDSTLSTMAVRLRALSAPPSGAQFDTSYTRLRNYLIVTQYPERSTGDALAPDLMADWPPASALDTANRTLAQRQFQRLGRELVWRNPYGQDVAQDQEAIGRARQVLRQSATVRRIYQAIIDSASRAARPINFNRDFGAATGGVVAVNHVVAGAFTRDGYALVRAGILDVDRYSASDAWVMGDDSTRPRLDHSQLERELRASHDSEYVESWRTFVRKASISPFTNVGDAARKLNVLANEQSPLLLLFALVNEHISVSPDTLAFGKPFESIRAMGAPLLSAPRSTDVLTRYLAQLSVVAQKVGTVASNPNREAALPQIADAQNAADLLAAELSPITGKMSPANPVNLDVARLLRLPGDLTSRVLRSESSRASVVAERNPVNEGGRNFCAQFLSLGQKSPFVRGAELASGSELAAILSSGGLLWTKLANDLQSILTRSGMSFIRNASARNAPEEAALRFVNRLARISEALYDGTVEAQMQWTIAPVLTDRVQQVTLVFGGRSEAFTRRAPAARTITWRIASDKGISIRDVRGAQTIPGFEGAWAPLTFFMDAKNWMRDASGYRFDIEVDTVTVAFHATMKPAVAELLRGELFASFPPCPPRWVRE